MRWLKVLLSISMGGSILYMAFFFRFEVVSPGRGITIIDESSHVIYAPESGYVTNLMVSKGGNLLKNDALLTYRNLDDEYLLKKTVQSLLLERQQYKRLMDEYCFLNSTQLPKTEHHIDLILDCVTDINSMPMGGHYIYQYYKDYIEEKQHQVSLSIQRSKQKRELLNKRAILDKKKNALRKGRAETIRFFDIEVQIKELNNEIKTHDLIELENQKKVDDKMLLFQLKRSEKALELEEKIQLLKQSIDEKTHTASLLEEKKTLSALRSPFKGTTLKMKEGITIGSYIEKGTELFELKKEGASQSIRAKFDTQYRQHLVLNAPVKIKIISLGKHHIFNGKISSVSSDSLELEQGNQDTPRYYEVTIAPEQSFINSTLSLGLEVEVYVISNKVTLFDYIASVFAKNTLMVEAW